MSFDADTALEPAGEGRWRGSVPPSWSIGTGPNGGFMAALAARAAGLASAMAPRSLTLHYLAPPADAVAPALPAPEDCIRVEPGRTNVPPLMSRYDMRIAPGEEGERPARIAGWIRTAEPRAADDIALAAMTDAYVPPAFLRAGERVVVPTLELTIHFRGLPPAGEHPWIAAAFTTRVAAGGVCEEDGELWSADGRLLAQSRQLALVRRP